MPGGGAVFDGVDEIPWRRLGPWPERRQDGVPYLLRAIVDAPSDVGDRSPVWGLRYGLVDGSGPEVYPAAPHLVPYLVEATGVARQPHRGLLVELMTDIAVARPYRNFARDPAAGPEPDYAALARTAMVERADALVRLLDDVSPRVVAATARLLAVLPDAAPRTLPALRTRAEKPPRTRAGARGDAGAVACVLAVAWLAATEHATWFADLLGPNDARPDPLNGEDGPRDPTDHPDGLHDPTDHEDGLHNLTDQPDGLRNVTDHPDAHHDAADHESERHDPTDHENERHDPTDRRSERRDPAPREGRHRELRAAAAAGLGASGHGGGPGDESLIRLVADVQADPGSPLDRMRWFGYDLSPVSAVLMRAERWHLAVTRELLSRPGARKIGRRLFAAREAIWRWRSAPAELLPSAAGRVRDLLSTPPAERRREGFVRGKDSLVDAVDLIAESGQASAAYADVLAARLTGDPGEPWPEAAEPAMVGLARLGDHRCIPWLSAAFGSDEYLQFRYLDAGDLIPPMAAHADALTPALLAVLGPAPVHGHIDYIECLKALVSWGAAAAPLLPAIAERLAPTYTAFMLPLVGAVGPAAAAVEPQVRALLDGDRDLGPAAWALWRITGEPGRAPALLAADLAGSGHRAGEIAPLLEQLGPAAASAVPALRKHFDNPHYGHRYNRVALARALWAITSDSTGLVQPLLKSLAARPMPDLGLGGHGSELAAIEALGTMGRAAAEAVPALTAIAYGPERVTERDAWGDEHHQRAAQRALTLIEGV
ncbi:hypothetical protein HII36_44550 [Nonomuraea sp. NN258]|uniref:hypothetical protein n=1 Tax=Nonomuraea antri TaxID=2730852 RepID=UPI001568275C|nr:hypothetical protein [Nonomuraea antri]NRQ38847.1 hypothetical protein [Nonomuraea antri]